MTTTLRVLSRYRNSTLGLDWQAGHVEPMSDEQAAYLMRDAEGVFEEVDSVGLEAAAEAAQVVLDDAYGKAPEDEADEAEDDAGDDQPDDDGGDVDEDDDLEALLIEDLRELAEHEDVELAGLRAKPAIIEAIRASRAENG